MISLANLILKSDGKLEFMLDEELLVLFSNDEEMYSYIDLGKLTDAVIPFVNELIKRAKGNENDL